MASSNRISGLQHEISVEIAIERKRCPRQLNRFARLKQIDTQSAVKSPLNNLQLIASASRMSVAHGYLDQDVNDSQST